MRLVFIGKNHPFSFLPLESLARDHVILAVVESGPRASGQVAARRTRIRRVANRLLGRGLPGFARAVGAQYLFMDRGANDDLERLLRGCEPDLLVVASLSQLLPPSVLAVPRLGAINLHPSRLPAYPGPFPWFWQYHDFVLDIGVTAHYLDEGEDTGPILASRDLTLAVGTDIVDAMRMAGTVGAELLPAVLRDLADGTARPRPQKRGDQPRARRVERHERFIDWESWSLEHVWHFMRGTYPWVDPVDYPDGFQARVGSAERGDAGAPVGTLASDRRGFYVAHRDGRIRLLGPGSRSSRGSFGARLPWVAGQ